MNATEAFFVDCVRAGLTGQTVNKVPNGIDFRLFYRLCGTQTVDTVVIEALRDVAPELPQNFYAALQRCAGQHAAKDIAYAADTARVLAALEEAGIRHMPLKGYHLKKLYPKSEMRYASDCDILIDASEFSHLRKLYAQMGLKKTRKDEHHDVAVATETGTMFEFHRKLFVGKLGDYFGTGFARARLQAGYRFRYEFSPEDFYLTILAHSAYHFYEGGGVGIRHVADLYVYRRAHRLDETYLQTELVRCGLQRFEARFRQLAEHFFKDAPADDFLRRLADRVVSSAVLANKEVKPAMDVVYQDGADLRKSKRQSVWRLIFPPMATMRIGYPVLKKAGFLLPFCYFLRWLRVLFRTPARLTRFKQTYAVSDEALIETKEICEGLGIDSLWQS